MITALAIMIAIAGYLQFAGTNLEKEYLASDNTEDLSAVDSTDIVTDMESLDSDVEIVMEDYLDEDMQVAEATPDEGEIPGEAVLTGTIGVWRYCLLQDFPRSRPEPGIKRPYWRLSTVLSSAMPRNRKRWTAWCA